MGEKGQPIKKRSFAFFWWMVVLLLLCAAGVYLIVESANAPLPAPPPLFDPVWGDYARG